MNLLLFAYLFIPGWPRDWPWSSHVWGLRTRASADRSISCSCSVNSWSNCTYWKELTLNGKRKAGLCLHPRRSEDCQRESQGSRGGGPGTSVVPNCHPRPPPHTTHRCCSMSVEIKHNTWSSSSRPSACVCLPFLCAQCPRSRHLSILQPLSSELHHLLNGYKDVWLTWWHWMIGLLKCLLKWNEVCTR